MAEEALAVARRIGGSVVTLYPLVAVISAATNTDPPLDPARALECAEECVHGDRTQRQTCSNIGRTLIARIRMTRGEIAEGLIVWRRVLEDYDERGERGVFTLSLPSLADALAHIDPSAAIQVAAIGESEAIARSPAFASFPALGRLAEERPTEVAAAHARAATMSYDDALEFVFATVDQLIAEHGPTTA